MIADDLFAGAGGWDLAAAELGIHARGVENMKEARATREAAGLTTIHDDVWTFQPDDAATGLIASPPCQTYSQAGSGAGRKALDDVLRGIRGGYYTSLDHLRFLGEEVGDERTALVLTPLHFALSRGYEWLAWEQVPTVLPVWEACADRLRAANWNVWTGLLNAEQYGVPQARRRAVLLASRHHVVQPPSPTHSMLHRDDYARLDAGVLPYVTVADALPDRAREGTLPAWCYVRPSTTVVGTFHPEIVAAPGYRTDVSRQNAPDSLTVSVAEAGVLQSFPATFPWQGGSRGGQGPAYLQIGNAIPPGMALHALAAASQLDLEQERAA